MRSFVLLAVAVFLPAGLSAGPFFGGNSAYSGSESALSANPAPNPSAVFQGYSGVSMPMPALRPLPRPGLNLSALNSMGMAKSRSLRDHWAIGVDSIPAVSAGAGPMVAVPNALSVRWWATDRLSLDLLAGGAYNSAQAGSGELSPLVSSSPGSAAYAGGLGFHYNVASLSRDLLSQVVVKASGAQAAGSISGWSGRATQTTLAVFAGAGFEAFVPGWDWLSIEASAGVTGLSRSLTPQGSGAQTLSGVGLAGSAFSPLNLAVHVYF